MVVLGMGAVSYERGTSVPLSVRIPGRVRVGVAPRPDAASVGQVPYLTHRINQMVLESQLPHKIVNLFS